MLYFQSEENLTMLYKIVNFETKVGNDVPKRIYDLHCGEQIPIYTISNIHDLTQFIGYGKYINNKVSNVYFRGQPELYNGKLIPSYLRNGTGKLKYSTITNYRHRIKKYIESSSSFQQYDYRIFEPLIQHYGIKTLQIDCVDNIWVALWFATHKAKRKPINGTEHIYFYPNNDEMSYILLIASDALDKSKDIMGFYTGEITNVVDLRKALPSYFLRPHAQHAYMIKKNDDMAYDYSDLIVGIAEIPTTKALQWIGNGELLSTSTLFPSPVHDDGYAVIMKRFPQIDASEVNSYGSIQIIND